MKALYRWLFGNCVNLLQASREYKFQLGPKREGNGHGASCLPCWLAVQGRYLLYGRSLTGVSVEIANELSVDDWLTLLGLIVIMVFALVIKGS